MGLFFFGSACVCVCVKQRLHYCGGATGASWEKKRKGEADLSLQISTSSALSDSVGPKVHSKESGSLPQPLITQDLLGRGHQVDLQSLLSTASLLFQMEFRVILLYPALLHFYLSLYIILYNWNIYSQRFFLDFGQWAQVPKNICSPPKKSCLI